jgi:hypothetical protein
MTEKLKETFGPIALLSEQRNFLERNHWFLKSLPAWHRMQFEMIQNRFSIEI